MVDRRGRDRRGVRRVAVLACTPLRAGDDLRHPVGVGVDDWLDVVVDGAGAAVDKYGLDVGGRIRCGRALAAVLQEIDVARGDLNTLRRLYEDRLGAKRVGAGCCIERIHLEPLRPAAVGTLGTHVGDDVAVALPRQAKQRELAVAGELLDHTTLLGLLTLGAHRCVIHGDIRTLGEGLAGVIDVHLRRGRRLDLDNVVAAERSGDNEGHGHHRSHQRAHPGGLPIQALPLLHVLTPVAIGIKVTPVKCSAS